MNLRFMAEDILALHDEMDYLRAENTRLRKVQDDYNQLLSNDIAHGEKMMGSLLNLILQKVIVDREPTRSTELRERS